MPDGLIYEAPDGTFQESNLEYLEQIAINTGGTSTKSNVKLILCALVFTDTREADFQTAVYGEV